MAEQSKRSTVVKKSRAQWESDRAALIAETGLTYGALREYGETWQLRDGERSRWETIRRINAILKDEPEGDFRGKAPEPDWADLREMARNAGWTRKKEGVGLRPVATDVWGLYPPGQRFAEVVRCGAARVGLAERGLFIELHGPGKDQRERADLINPTPAKVLAIARELGVGAS